ncbi:MAG: pentapeptide repeat-containing protein [Methylomonas sp.]|nr:pentapeptide repeat-containing protein [Methylomonas sp.]
MKFPIKHRFSGDVICEIELDASYENEPRSVQLGAAVKIAVSKNINLTGADLAYANLAYADLAYANLTDANLAYANLAYADLTDANLAYADLANANLTDANLAYADLTDANLAYAKLTHAKLTHANLTGANLTGADIAYANLANANLAGQGLLQINGLRWPVLVTPEYLKIGCEQHSHDYWRSFDDRRILQMAGKNAAEFWADNKTWLLERCEWAAGFRKRGAT